MLIMLLRQQCRFHKALSLFILCMFLLSSIVAGTLAWQDFSQHSANGFEGWGVQKPQGETGTLSITKTVKNADGSEVTDVQKAMVFLFTVTLDNDGVFIYQIDGGIERDIVSGETISLRSGETAVIYNIPAGTAYSVSEQETPGYAVQSDNHSGSVLPGGQTVSFVNIAGNRTEGDKSLAITKEVTGDGAEEHKYFSFTVTFGVPGSYPYTINGTGPLYMESGGVIQLRHGESALFEALPEGMSFAVVEHDYAGEGYYTDIGSYAGTLIQNKTVLPFVNRKTSVTEGNGVLSIAKQVTGNEQLKKEAFTFEVVFDGECPRVCTVNGTDKVTLSEDNTVKLKHGDTAVFEDIPIGTGYLVRELDDEKKCTPVVKEFTGVVSGAHAVNINFSNIADDEPDKPVTPGGGGSLSGSKTVLSIRKKVTGTEVDANKAFEFTLIVNGAKQTFSLKHNEEKRFTVSRGANYEVVETDYASEGYMRSELINGKGTANRSLIEVVQTNHYTKTEWVAIQGEKTWDMTADSDARIPESIVVSVKDKETVVDRAVVKPDGSGKWHYAFEVPKYRTGTGEEIRYTVDEEEIPSFNKTIDGYNIKNTYVRAAGFTPVIRKQVTGMGAFEEFLFSFCMEPIDNAPMPKGIAGDKAIVSLIGEGEVVFPEILFTKAGVYQYRIYELSGETPGVTYDKTVYTMTVTVENISNVLSTRAVCQSQDGVYVESLVFTNLYEEDYPDTGENIVISGKKHWEHGTLPPEQRPEFIDILILSNGSVYQRISVSAVSDWTYAIAVPKYDALGQEIEYTVDEIEIEGYTKAIDGYNITNTHASKPPSVPSSSHTPKTGDSFPIEIWLYLLITSAAVLYFTLIRRF